jgi:3-dehydroquinate synthase
LSAMITVPVNLAARSYNVLIGRDILDDALSQVPELFPRHRTLIVTDENVAPLHLSALTGSLDKIGIKADCFILKPGEASKSFDSLEKLVDAFLEHSLERNETVIALGGGVIGDLVGFAASITKRGINFIQIPTTLLAQIDSSVGGKTGINTRHGKNFVGSFHQPRLVIADQTLLDSLPKREQVAGYAEIIKAAFIGDAQMFERLENYETAVFSEPHLSHAIAAAVAFKAKIVADDEREQGTRALLNLGHTFAHAFEAEAPRDAVRHGEAVAAGLALAFQYSVHLGVCPDRDAQRVVRHLNTVGLPDGPLALRHSSWSARALVARMRDDKKNQNGQITLVLARGIGSAYIHYATDETDLVRFMESML